MKSLETIFVEYTEAATAAKKLSAEEISEATKLPTIEQRLAKVKAVAEARGFQVAVHRIKRNAGSGFDPNATVTESEARIAEYAKHARCSIREASIILTGEDPGPKDGLSESFKKDLAKRWKSYIPALSEVECETLAAKGIEP